MDSNAGAPSLTGRCRQRICRQQQWHRQRHHQWHHHVGFRLLAGLVAVSLLMGCGTERRSEASLDELVQVQVPGLNQQVPNSDQWEVVICRIPLNTGDPTFAAIDHRLEVTSAEIVAAINPITEYFRRWSYGRYAMTVVPGDDVLAQVNDDVVEPSRNCVESALDASDSRSTAVIVIADAAHRDDVPGGWAQPGIACDFEATTCPARQSRRAVYLGGADFFEIMDKGIESVALDLVEHEIGHVLGWPHSSRNLIDGDATVATGYDSVIDIMSNSAAPRSVNSNRRHGPGVLAFNQLSAGWLAPEDVATMMLPESGAVKSAVIRAPAERSRRYPRLFVLPVGDTAAVTIELIARNGDNDHVSRSGVAVHLVEWGKEACAVPNADNICVGVDRRLTLLGEGAEGLLRRGQSVTIQDLTVSVLSLDGRGVDLTADIAVWRR